MISDAAKLAALVESTGDMDSISLAFFFKQMMCVFDRD